jgi:hypothetical protein
VGAIALQELLPPPLISSVFLSRKCGKQSLNLSCTKSLLGTFRLDPEPPQLQQDILSLPVTEQQLSPHQQSLSSSPMPEFLNLISPKCASGPRLLVYSRQRQRQEGVSARGPATPLKGSTAAVDVVDPAPLEAPCTTAPSTRETFITMLAQQTACILSPPASIKRCLKTRPAGDTPQRSR